MQCEQNSHCQMDCNSPNSCKNVVIMANFSQSLKVSCAYNSCKNMIIYATNSSATSNQITINCYGISSCRNLAVFASLAQSISIECTSDNACNGMAIHANGAQDISLLAQSKSHFYQNAAFQNGVISALNTQHLFIHCLGQNGKYACVQSKILIANQTQIECDGGNTCLTLEQSFQTFFRFSHF